MILSFKFWHSIIPMGIKSNFPLYFLELPFVVIDTSTKNFQQGEEIQCACLVKGFPEPTVVWNKDGKQLTSNGVLQITDDQVLIIKNAKPSDAGRYECLAWNTVGQSRAVVNLRHTGTEIM
jgi:hypothetical protein